HHITRRGTASPGVSWQAQIPGQMGRCGRNNVRPHHRNVLIRIVVGNGEGKVVNGTEDARPSSRTLQVGAWTFAPRRAPAPMSGPRPRPAIVPHVPDRRIHIGNW